MRTERSAAYIDYDQKINGAYYKNVESALGNIYRAARDEKISLVERDELIAFAKKRYKNLVKSPRRKKKIAPKKGDMLVRKFVKKGFEITVLDHPCGLDIKIRDKNNRKE